ncbi:Spo71p KNAG_0H03080 [Huiozyma naganishii CBS 8797]|uniref:PH domain-containing protein n=1 Tax=Huiozyma naganishii (strain ATCC MYA-139 / BCRC 22969 / CBS 8797 / KCTC 17520 / NBRC 10181 / NCYC 3082 / Yp74L-3) TaxID=1071383 RepID=J7RPQ9_HUIN7|nr:hypothetical protein KNAG_0H03080 [Kazachstania naganishii CBS 8797]CCK71723.1 hypothetical protein KNAG_0H03080 [Kazachstania naganishii CBS 8797]
MPLTTRTLLETVADDQRYIESINPNCPAVKRCLEKEDQNVDIFSIPRYSFTAFRLSYASPLEISLSSKVILLGGVPKQWSQEQKNPIWKVVAKLTSRQLKKRTKLVSLNAYRSIYKRRAKRVKTNTGQVSVSCKGNLDESGNGLTTKIATTSNGSIGKVRPFTAPNPTVSGPHTFLNPDATMGAETCPIKCKDNDTVVSDIRHVPSRRYTSVEVPILRIDDTSSSSVGEIIFDNSCKNDELSNTDTRRDSTPNSIHTLPCKQNPMMTELQAIKCDSNRAAALEPVQTLSCHERNMHERELVITQIETLIQTTSRKKVEKIKTNDDEVRLVPTASQNSSSNTNNTVELNIQKLTRLLPEPDNTVAHEMIRSCKKDKGMGKNILILNNTKITPFNSHSPEVSNTKNTVKRRSITGLPWIDDKLGGKDENAPKCKNILKMDKMLVMVKVAVKHKEPIPEFNETECIDTRIEERWKEYIVVARETDYSPPSVLLQFYRKRKLLKKSLAGASKEDMFHGTALAFLLDRNCLVRFYSTLDKTISIQVPDHLLQEIPEEEFPTVHSEISPLKIYILRCSTLAKSYEWFVFLQKQLNRRAIPKCLSIKIPEVGLVVRATIHEPVMNFLTELEKKEEDSLKVAFLTRGYRIFQCPLLRYLTVVVFQELKRSGYQDQIDSWQRTNTVLGCDMRRYDRIEWCSGQESAFLKGSYTLEKTHLLEFRSLVHYPRQIRDDSGKTMLEPTPIEGYLLKCCNKFGADKLMFGRNFVKPSYFFTCDNLLFHLNSLEAVPPLPLNIEVDEYGLPSDIDAATDEMENMAVHFEQDPYPITMESHISWLNKDISLADFNSRDHYAFKCFNRRIAQILKTNAILEMTRIKEIKQGCDEDFWDHEMRNTFLHATNLAFWQKKGMVLSDFPQSVILITTDDELTLKLAAPSPIVAKEWVSSLKRMVSFWKERQKHDVQEMWGVKRFNLEKLRINDMEEANINEGTAKWICDRGKANVEQFNVNSISLLKPLLQKGLLYQKPKKHSVFSKYYVLLIPGFLMLFHCYHRSTTGFAESVLDYSHYMTIPIDKCYLYSGSTTDLDLLERDHTFDYLNPGNHTLPRVYPDGWKSNEDEPSRCFTLWFGDKKELIKSSKIGKTNEVYECGDTDQMLDSSMRDDADSKSKSKSVKWVDKLGVNGRTMVFMARSRQERDLWVLSIYNELERLKKTD